MPFDAYTWALTLASVVGVSIALIVNDKICSTWSEEPSRNSIFISICSIFNSLYCLQTFFLFGLPGIAFAIGAVIDEAQAVLVKKKTHNIITSSSSKAKLLIILIWIIFGYLLTLGYESVLRAMLMKTYYQNKIDSIDDMLASKRELLVYRDSLLYDQMTSDPRPKVRNLAKTVTLYTADVTKPMFGYEWIARG